MVNFSKAQQQASDRVLQFVSHPFTPARELLIWAVAGAGKTETIFTALSYVLNQGKNVLIATPRKDVVIELTPRLQRAFPEQNLISLHGESRQKGEIGNFVIATTHQAMNFYRYFDLVILDEVDAFPYHNNPMLQHAVRLARTEAGQQIYLTATPPQQLLQSARTGNAELVMIPSRHHGYPLVEPKIIMDSQLNKCIQQKRLPRAIIDFIQHLHRTHRQGFLFLPKVDLIPQMAALIHTYVSQQNINKNSESRSEEVSWVAGTYANDPQRQSKIEAFRQRKISLLITTTILERGVTIPSTDCLVAFADAHIFDESALVQMAGRVGRSTDDPTGCVIYLGMSRSDAMVKAVKQIKRMNRMAREKGFLHKGNIVVKENRILSNFNRVFGRKE